MITPGRALRNAARPLSVTLVSVTTTTFSEVSPCNQAGVRHGRATQDEKFKGREVGQVCEPRVGHRSAGDRQAAQRGQSAHVRQAGIVQPRPGEVECLEPAAPGHLIEAGPVERGAVEVHPVQFRQPSELGRKRVADLTALQGEVFEPVQRPEIEPPDLLGGQVVQHDVRCPVSEERPPLGQPPCGPGGLNPTYGHVPAQRPDRRDRPLLRPPLPVVKPRHARRRQPEQQEH
jgi:hypothetical protein